MQSNKDIEQSQTPMVASDARRQSKLGHILQSLRHSPKLAQDKNAEHHSVQQQATENTAQTSTSPSLEAMATYKLNGYGADANQANNQESWGFPGLGTFSNQHVQSERVSPPRTASPPSNTQHKAKVEPTKSEGFGWPGLGSWSSK